MDTDFSFPLGQIPFANQEKVLNEVREIVCCTSPGSFRGILYSVNTGSGFTRFLENVKQNLSENVIAIYVDAEQSSETQVISDFFSELTAFQKNSPLAVKKKLRSKIRDALDLLSATYADFEGPGSNTLGKLAELLGGTIRSISLEKFRQVLEEMPEEINVLFMIDNSEKNQHLVHSLAKSIFSERYQRVFFVIGFDLAENDELPSFSNRIGDIGIPLSQQSFPKPSISLINEILDIVNLKAPQTLLESILRECNQNLHKVISALRNRNPGEKGMSFSPAANAFISYLTCTRQSLSLSQVQALILRDVTVFIPENEDWFEHVLGELDQYVYVSDGDNVQVIRAPPIPISANSKIHASEHVYAYFLEQYSLGFAGPKALSILFRLSQTVDTERSAEFAESMVRLSLENGDLEMGLRFFPHIKNSKDCRNFGEFILRASFLITTKRYSEALSCIENVRNEDWRESKVSQILMAVATNRCREHNRSLELIEKIKDRDDLTLEQKALLSSFEISGLIHSFKREEAYDRFLEDKLDLIQARNYGYFLRNSLSACSTKEAIELGRECMQLFNSQNDLYGLSTTSNNLGVYLALDGDMQNALIHFKSALDSLSAFGLAHIEEALMNCGLSKMVMGDLDEAEKLFARCVRVFSPNVPKFYAMQSLALVYAVNRENEEAIALLISGYDLAKSVGVKPHIQRYVVNASLISNYIDPVSAFAIETKKLARDNPYCYGTSESLKVSVVLEQPKISVEELMSLFLQPYMSYWSQEPLFVLDDISTP